jgi:hypothetical protein
MRCALETEIGVPQRRGQQELRRGRTSRCKREHGDLQVAGTKALPERVDVASSRTSRQISMIEAASGSFAAAVKCLID